MMNEIVYDKISDPFEDAINKPVTCCFSGHRPEKLPWGDDESATACVALKQNIGIKIEELVSSGIRFFICGMARGADMYFAEAALSAAAAASVFLEAAIPYPGQYFGFSENERARYIKILESCNRKTLISQHYSKGCMLTRNRYMVDKSCVLLTVLGDAKGGTSYTRRYADKRGLRIINIPPEEI